MDIVLAVDLGSDIWVQATILRAETQCFKPVFMDLKSLAILIGDPVGHSLSPTIMQAAMDAAGIPVTYLAMKVQDAHLAAAIDGMHALGIVGANVTIPHKERVMDFLDELSPTARAVGAVNTIVMDDDGRFTGENTDVAGFVAPIRGLETPAAALVLGTGGAARAVAYACAVELGIGRVLISGRSQDKADALVESLTDAADLPDHVLSTIPWDERANAIPESGWVVNATSVGMQPRVDETPLPDARGLSADHLVYDLVYRPHPTRLLKDAAERGARTQGGLDMLIGQAAAAFRLWTGVDMNLEAVRAALSAAGFDSSRPT